MKRLLCLFCLLGMLCGACAESDPERIAEAAAPLLAAILRCPSIASFEAEPSRELCLEASRSLAELSLMDGGANGIGALTPKDACALMFVSRLFPRTRRRKRRTLSTSSVKRTVP